MLHRHVQIDLFQVDQSHDRASSCNYLGQRREVEQRRGVDHRRAGVVGLAPDRGLHDDPAAARDQRDRSREHAIVDRTGQQPADALLEIAGQPLVPRHADPDGVVSYGTGSTGALIIDNVITGTTTWDEAALGASGNNEGEGIVLTGPGNVIAFNDLDGVHTSFVLDTGVDLLQKPFEATTLLAKCPSKYEAAEDGGAAEAAPAQEVLEKVVEVRKWVEEKAAIDGYFPDVVRPKAAAVGPVIAETFARAWAAPGSFSIFW